jgi:hypothetical protein
MPMLFLSMGFGLPLAPVVICFGFNLSEELLFASLDIGEDLFMY